VSTFIASRGEPCLLRSSHFCCFNNICMNNLVLITINHGGGAAIVILLLLLAEEWHAVIDLSAILSISMIHHVVYHRRYIALFAVSNTDLSFSLSDSTAKTCLRSERLWSLYSATFWTQERVSNGYKRCSCCCWGFQSTKPFPFLS